MPIPEELLELFHRGFGAMTFSDNAPLYGDGIADLLARQKETIKKRGITDRNGVRISGDQEIVDYLIRHTPKSFINIPSSKEIPEMIGRPGQVLSCSGSPTWATWDSKNQPWFFGSSGSS